MVLLILAVLWGIVLVPPALRARAERRRARSVYRFRRQLQVLAPPPVPAATRAAEAARPPGAARSHVALIASPTPPPAPEGKPAPSKAAAPARPPRPVRPVRRRTHAELLRRRRRVLSALVLATVSTAAAVTFTDLVALPALQIVVDVALAGYVIGLRRLRRLAVERRAKVRYLPTPAVPVEIPAEAEAEAEVVAETETEVPLRSASASS